MITRPTFRLAAFACAAGLAGVACGGASSGDDASQPTATVEPAPVETDAPSPGTATEPGGESGAVVPASLQFSAPLIGGGEIVGDELAGKPTAFWFWSPT